MKARLILASIILGGMVYTTNAQTATPKVDARQENQKERIQEGVRSGEITKPEAKKLRARKQDRASENIKHENHDGHNHK